jgi:hypothetical protein
MCTLRGDICGRERAWEVVALSLWTGQSFLA